MFNFKDCKDESFSLSADNYYAINYNGFNMKTHSHNSLEIMYCESGAAEVVCYFNNDKFIHNLKKNQCIFINANVPHYLCIKDNAKTRVLNIELIKVKADNINIGKILKESKDLTYAYLLEKGFFTVYDDSNILDDLNNILSELSPGRKYNKSYLELMYIKLLIDIARAYNLYNTTDVYHVQKALDYMRENFSSDISVEDIARAVKLHPSYLQKQIKKHTSKSIVAHINTFRTERAKVLIANTNSSLTQISIDCGFCNRQTFYNAFKKYVGVNPREYKKEITRLKDTKQYQRYYQ